MTPYNLFSPSHLDRMIHLNNSLQVNRSIRTDVQQQLFRSARQRVADWNEQMSPLVLPPRAPVRSNLRESVDYMKRVKPRNALEFPFPFDLPETWLQLLYNDAMVKGRIVAMLSERSRRQLLAYAKLQPLHQQDRVNLDLVFANLSYYIHEINSKL